MIVRRAALALAGCTSLDLAAREIARRSIVAMALGATPPVWFMVALAIAAALALAFPPRTSPSTAAFFLALFTVGVALQLQLGARLQSDGFYYYAYLRSIAFDHDVDFTNDYRMLGLGQKANLFLRTPTGYAQSAWTIGPAIVWAPFFAVGHLVAIRLHAEGHDVPTDGTSYPYRQAVCIAGLVYGLLGCWLTYRLVRGIFRPSLAAAATALTVCGSFMLWYMVKEPSMTHAPSMAAVALFLVVWFETRDDRRLRTWALLGVLTGLVALIRWQNVLFGVLPGLEAATRLATAWRRRDAKLAVNILTASGLLLVCAVLAFLPQMLAWKAIYGGYVARSPLGPQIRWGQPHVADVLWSAHNGLLSTTPILYLGAIGLLVFAFWRPPIGVPLLAAVAVMTYFNATIQDWWGSAAFGARRFDGTLPVFAIGLAAFLDWTASFVRRRALTAVIAAFSLLVLWNLGLMAAASRGLVNPENTLPFDDAWAVEARVVHGWFGNPFTYPASLLFALRNDASPGLYDSLWTDRFLTDPLRPYGRIDIGDNDDVFLGDGWNAPEHDGAISFRWAASPAVLRVPLDHAATLRVQVRLHAFAYPGSPAQSMVVSVNGRPCAPLAVPAGWTTVECSLDAPVWRRGLNRLAFEFGYVRRPVDVGLGGDTRLLSAAVDWVRVLATVHEP